MKCLIDNENSSLNYYLAGYFEAKGIICIHKRKYKDSGRIKYNLTCAANFPNKKIGTLFKKNFGGSLHKVVTNKKLRRSKYMWIACNDNVLDFLYAVKPYLLSEVLIKRINLAVKFRMFQLKNYHKFTYSKVTGKPKPIKKIKDKFVKEMRRLNKL